MPCTTSNFDNVGPNYNQSNDRINELEAMLCALLSELENMGLSDQVMRDAEINGKVDVRTFWEGHKELDVHRLTNELSLFLSRFSEHERVLMNNIMTKKI